MMITNIQNSNFQQTHQGPRQNSGTQAPKPAKNIPTNRQLVPTQPTEYKRFTNPRQHSSNPFLAQYIHQSNNQRTRGYIGRRPPSQANASYKNSFDIVDNLTVSNLDKSI